MRFEAVIFDMDGVLMDSEDLWRKAMKKAFAEFGFKITEEQCKSTMGMRIKEVIAHWLHAFAPGTSIDAVDKRVMQLLLEHVRDEGNFIEGIPQILAFLENKQVPLGLATSSSHELMAAILGKLGIKQKFKALTSAEFLEYGKPHPEVFLGCAKTLGVNPKKCLVIEDSLNGVVAAKAASMQVIAVPDADNLSKTQFAIADFRFDTMPEVLPLLQRLFTQGD